MSDPRVDAVAKILVEYSAGVKPGQFVAIMGKSQGAPMMLAVYEHVLRQGAHPWFQVDLEGSDEIFYRVASDEQLQYLPSIMEPFVEAIDASINIWTEVNTKQLSNVDPSKQSMRAKARQPIMKRFMERTASGEFNWALGLYPTQSFAQDAEMSLREYEDFVYDACLVHEPNPVAAWQALSKEQQKLIDWIKDKDEIHVVGPDTDLKMSVKGRIWQNADGRKNFPDGEIFTGPIEDSVNGHIRFTYPACLQGREVEDVHLWFEKGKVVKAQAAKNEEFLMQMLDTDDGARFLGEFAIGTNQGIQKFTKNILFDEKIGGTVHMAVGAGYPETGSKNKSAIHWDMICDLRKGGTVYVDGEKFAEEGKVLIN